MRLLLAAALLLLGLVCVWAREEAYLFLWAAQVQCRADFPTPDFGVIGIGSTLWDPALTVEHFGFVGVAVPGVGAAPGEWDALGQHMAIPVALSQAMHDALSTSYSTNCDFEDTVLLQVWHASRFLERHPVRDIPPDATPEQVEAIEDENHHLSARRQLDLSRATLVLAHTVHGAGFANCPSTVAPHGWALTQAIVCFARMRVNPTELDDRRRDREDEPRLGKARRREPRDGGEQLSASASVDMMTPDESADMEASGEDMALWDPDSERRGVSPEERRRQYQEAMVQRLQDCQQAQVQDGYDLHPRHWRYTQKCLIALSAGLNQLDMGPDPPLHVVSRSSSFRRADADRGIWMGRVWPEFCSDYSDAWDCSDDATYFLMQRNRWIP
jgi:hypothetical protein